MPSGRRLLARAARPRLRLVRRAEQRGELTLSLTLTLTLTLT